MSGVTNTAALISDGHIPVSTLAYVFVGTVAIIFLMFLGLLLFASYAAAVRAGAARRELETTNPGTKTGFHREHL